jgi:hypothetical protein
MSNRKRRDDIDGLAQLKLSHEIQIEALTKVGLTRLQRMRAFMHAAAGGTLTGKEMALEMVMQEHSTFMSVARVMWKLGDYPDSLFAYLPSCQWCPVQLKQYRRAYGSAATKYPELPEEIPDGTPPYFWNPDEKTLRAFAKVQQQARFPEITK